MTTPTYSAALPALQLALAQQSFPAALYIVATPIGNIADITLRALHLLSLADTVACEDTRNTATLLQRYQLHRPLLALHQHNEQTAAQTVIHKIQAGEKVAYVSDAGTPGISDPGSKLVEAVRAANLPIIPLPGANAAITALSAAGQLSEQFTFLGFLPTKSRQRQQTLQSWQQHPATLVLYEAPHRIHALISDIAQILGPHRPLCIAREISKLFETFYTGTVQAVQQQLSADAHADKGEFVVMIGPAPAQHVTQQQAERLLSKLVPALGVSAASKLVAELTGLPKNQLYDWALTLSTPSASESSSLNPPAST